MFWTRIFPSARGPPKSAPPRKDLELLDTFEPTLEFLLPTRLPCLDLERDRERGEGEGEVALDPDLALVC